MEVKEKKKKENLVKSDNKTKMFFIYLVSIVSLVLVVLMVTSKEGNIENKVKSSLDKIVEKGDLETVNFTYNVIAKQCKDKNKCNKKSNNIDDFEYVVSCKGTITAGIDFEKVEVKIDKKNKELIVTMPEANITETNVGSLKFFHGADIPANELPNARNLCKETIEEKSQKDGNLLPAAKEQAKVLLESFYKQWLKSFDKKYKIEVK